MICDEEKKEGGRAGREGGREGEREGGRDLLGHVLLELRVLHQGLHLPHDLGVGLQLHELLHGLGVVDCGGEGGREGGREGLVNGSHLNHRFLISACVGGSMGG